MFLLDTDVASLLRRRDRHPALAAWLQAQRASDVYLSVVTLAEVERGIARQRRRNPPFARELASWLEQLLAWHADRIVVVDAAIARRWGRLSGEAGHFNLDLLIAASALEHGLTVVTRNVRHFEPTGVPVLNPLDASGELGGE